MSLKDRLNTTPKPRPTLPKMVLPKEPLSGEGITLGVLDEILLDDEINSIYVNGSKNIYIEKNAKMQKSQKTFRDNIQLLNIIKKNARDNAIELNENKPYAKYNHTRGINIAISLPPLSDPVSMYIKCYQDKFATLNTLEEAGVISKEIALILQILANSDGNILIAGERNTLKTTFLSSLAKELSNSSRGVLIDYFEELKIERENFSNYDFSLLEKGAEFEILNSIINSNPTRLIVNECPPDTLNYLINKIKNGYRGLTMTTTAKNKIEALENITHSLLVQNPYLTYEQAKKLAYDSFDIIIFLKTDKKIGRIMSSLSQIKNGKIDDIFFFNSRLEFQSTGLTPSFYDQLKLNSAVNSNIFDCEYKHTSIKRAALEEEKPKTVNLEVLKKLKPEEPKQIFPKSQEELMRKAQEKFSKLKENAKKEHNLEHDEKQI